MQDQEENQSPEGESDIFEQTQLMEAVVVEAKEETKSNKGKKKKKGRKDKKSKKGKKGKKGKKK